MWVFVTREAFSRHTDGLRRFADFCPKIDPLCHAIGKVTVRKQGHSHDKVESGM